MNGTGGGSGGDGNLPGFYSYKNTFSPDSVWLEIPKKGEESHAGPLKRLLTNFSHFCRCYGSICRRSCGPYTHSTRCVHVCAVTSRLGP